MGEINMPCLIWLTSASFSTYHHHQARYFQSIAFIIILIDTAMASLILTTHQLYSSKLDGTVEKDTDLLEYLAGLKYALLYLKTLEIRGVTPVFYFSS